MTKPIKATLDPELKITFKDWLWGDDDDCKILDAQNALQKQIEIAIGKQMADTFQAQLEEDGVGVTLQEGPDGEPAISIDLDFLTVDDSVGTAFVNVSLVELFDRMIAETEDDPRVLIPHFRAMLAKLEASPVLPD